MDGLPGGGAALRRQRLHGRVPRRAALPRRQGAADLRRHRRDPDLADRARTAGDRREVWYGSVSTMRHPIPPNRPPTTCPQPRRPRSSATLRPPPTRRAPPRSLPDVLAASAAALKPIWPTHGETAVRAAGHVVRRGAVSRPAPHPPSRLAAAPGHRRARSAAAAPTSTRERLAAALAGVRRRRRRGLRHFKYYELARLTLRDLWAAPGRRRRHRGGARRALASRRCAARRRAASAPSAPWRAACRPSRSGRRPTARSVAPASPCSAWASSAAKSSTTRPTSTSSTCSRALGDRTARPPALSPAEYFGRVVRELGRLVTDTTGDGFLYRIDLDLRPGGTVRPAGGAERDAQRVLRRLGGDVGEGGVHEGAAGRRRSRASAGASSAPSTR